LVLIVLGTLMALSRFEDIGLSKTWPVLLIVLGVMKLLERLAARPAADGAGAGMGSGIPG
jgi:hypothetical protein